jgi:hypothetical protein
MLKHGTSDTGVALRPRDFHQISELRSNQQSVQTGQRSPAQNCVAADGL